MSIFMQTAQKGGGIGGQNLPVLNPSPHPQSTQTAQEPQKDERSMMRQVFDSSNDQPCINVDEVRLVTRLLESC